MKKRDEAAKTGKEAEVELQQEDTPSHIKSIAPQLAQLSAKPPEGEEWVHEVKFDGYRTLCQINGKDIKLFTRSQLNWAEKYKLLLPELRKLPVKSAWLDGEIVVLDEQGRSDFQLLQETLKASKGKNLRYYVFDLLELNGEDFREEPLIKRKERLKKIIKGIDSRHIFYSEHFEEVGKTVLDQCCKMGLEGIISKKRDSAYYSGRGPTWLKSKCGNAQEFVIGGYTEPKNTREGFGALIVGAYDKDKKLIYVGGVGTGFTNSTARDLMARFKKLKAHKSPFANTPNIKTAHWLKPELVGEVNFMQFTRDKILRHPAFKVSCKS